MARKMDRTHEAQAKLNRAMANGVGGLKFVAQSPPGLGRLIRIPFYLETATVGYCSLWGQASGAITTGASASLTYPLVTVFQPAAAITATPVAVLRTPRISWATLRIVGFESTLYVPKIDNACPMELTVSDLKVGGGANLFVHEDYGSARAYLAGSDSLAGLRDYPILKSPNQAEVQVQAICAGAGMTAPSNVINFNLSLICEILVDDNYGAHVPGPYARQGALVRQGGAFVNR